MGFFNKKDDTVMLPEKFKNSVIYPISNSMYTVNLGQNIVVGDGWNAVFGLPLQGRLFGQSLHCLRAQYEK